MKIDPNVKGEHFEIVGDVLDVEDLNLAGIAEALAADLRAAVQAQPGTKWNKTGGLVRGIRATEDAVTIPADHLTRDPILRDKFAAEVMPTEPISERVNRATEAAVAATVKAKKK